MPLRNPNDTDPAVTVLNALAVVLPGNPSANTQLGLNQNTYSTSCVAINSWGALYGPNGTGATFPFLMLEEETQSVARQQGAKTWTGEVVIFANYIHRWDRSAARMDAVWATIDADLRRMKANLEDNPTLSVQLTGEASVTRHAVSISRMELSPYKGSVNIGIYPFGLVARTLTINVKLPPYKGAA